jgi:Nucleotidyl transferase AbiEii toxin, Type IV TA system
MEEQFSKKWAFLRQHSDVFIEKAIGKMNNKIRKSLVFTGGTSLYLYSARLVFNDEPIRASEDIDFFNKNSRLVENPDGIEEKAIAEAYSRILGGFGFESEQRNNIVLISPHKIKAEFFYDSRSFPTKTYAHKGLAIIHPEALYHIKILLLAERENISERDLIDVLYLSTKYGLPSRIFVKEKIDALVEWKVVEDYLTQEGEEYFKRNDYQKIAVNFIGRVEVHEKD